MKKIIFLFTIIILSSCKEKANIKKPIETKTQIETINWLLGNWERTNDEKGKKTYENWYKKNNKHYYGIGFTLKDTDTISKETMRIIKNNNKWSLIVSVTGKGNDTSEVTFKITQLNRNSFTFENKENDFPNTIKYVIKDTKLKATISGSGMEIPFNFIRVKK